MDKNQIDILVQRAQQGDEEAFGTLILASEKLIYNIALRMMNNPEDAKDISQDVFIKAFKNIAKFDGKSSFSTWIYRIAVNTCIDEIRKRKGKDTLSMDKEIEGEENSFANQLESNEPTPEVQFLDKEKSIAIQNAINKLSLEHKTMITLRDLQGLSYTEISEAVGISIGTVKSRITRARKNLKDIIMQDGELYGNISRQNY